MSVVAPTASTRAGGTGGQEGQILADQLNLTKMQKTKHYPPCSHSSDGPVTSSPTKIEFLFQGSDLNALSTHVFSIDDIVPNWKIQNTSSCK